MMGRKMLRNELKLNGTKLISINTYEIEISNTFFKLKHMYAYIYVHSSNVKLLQLIKWNFI